jgi:Protein of unknown function (DUF3450)
MRNLIPISAVLLAAVCHGQTVTKDPNQQMREEVTRWVETMSRIQKEESEWARDREVLANYKEGLASEIASLHQAIADAETRKEGADKKTQEITTQHEQYAAARSELALQLSRIERDLVGKLPLFPKPLIMQPKVAQAIADLKTAAALPESSSQTDVSKRIYNLVELIAEAEKFHQQIHLAAELHQDAQGREFKIQVVYFGLAMAYGVNEDNSFAVVGSPARDGWKFTERTDLAPRIQQLVAAANEPKVATFTQLPLIQP